MQAKVKPDLNEAKALFVGIAFDTRHFALASAATLQIIAKLVTAGIDVQETLAQFALPIDTSERLAKLKACKRAKIIRSGRVDNRAFPCQCLSSFSSQSSVDLGAHVSAVAGMKNGKIEISLRSTRQFAEETGINLGKTLQPAGEWCRE